ncbi:hypothetical protein A6M21_04965 [Desulfotomaculum copahuensis]|uniref:Copper amine oxidase-like N-terminal domain-containing protein n=2 Tax=Desulfotomaculum copahuensis TaxID=1838280 RepID=A0A1B7LI07_9FIRM|nr:hypothetical protein A6M21_04965 [Desulfotomaculum copahuensis]
MDVAPYTQNGRTFLPVRYVAEAIGVSPDNILYRAGTITLSRGDTTVRLTIGSNVMEVNGKPGTMDVKATTLHGRAMLPASSVCRAFGTVPGWNAESRTVTIEELDPLNSGNQDGSPDVTSTSGVNNPGTVPFDAVTVLPQQPPVEIIPSLKYPASLKTVGEDYQWQYRGITYRWHMDVPVDLLDWDRKVAGLVNDFYAGDGVAQAVMLSSMPGDLQQMVLSCSDAANGDYVPWVNENLNYTYAGILAKWLSSQARADGYDYFHAAEFVQSFVGGAIPYKITAEPQLPAQTLVDDGDCKDKSILLAAILKNMGYKTALLSYSPPPGQTAGHMATGIAFDDSEITTDRMLSYYLSGNVKYYFAETTEPGWLIGQVSDEKMEKSGYVYPVN